MPVTCQPPSTQIHRRSTSRCRSGGRGRTAAPRCSSPRSGAVTSNSAGPRSRRRLLPSCGSRNDAGVDARAAAARRNVIRRVGQRLAQRVAHLPVTPFREPLFQPHLQRVVVGVDAVLHPLDVAERRIRPRARRLRAVRVGDHLALIQVAEPVAARCPCCQRRRRRSTVSAVSSYCMPKLYCWMYGVR